MDLINDILIGGTGGSIITMIVTKLLSKRSDKVDIEQRINTILADSVESMNQKIKEIESNANDLIKKNVELTLTNNQAQMQIKIYEQHLSGCESCDKSKIFKVQ